MYWKNLKRYWKEQLIHVAVGVLTGWLLMHGHTEAGAVLMGTVWIRQGLEWGNRSLIPRIVRGIKGMYDLEPHEYDTPGIDLAYHLTGLILGIATGFIPYL